ncbi:MAG: sodium-dependent transporter [Deltaproteobacteria bacterium]|nr:sodium-dependent transporter [Deltaproteobacteria bacterium]
MTERFTSRWGLLAACIGMAIGTGNIWRFPRVAAANGGGAFLVPWVIFLFVWSVPLLVAEFHLGRTSRRGPLGAFGAAVGPRSAWMGGFVAFTSLFIFAYYSVVTGWCFGYLLSSVTRWDAMVGGPETYWSIVSESHWSALGQLVGLIAAALVIRVGIASGIERVSKLLIPALFVLLVILAGYALTQPGASQGVRFLFVPDWSLLLVPSTWLEAASQSAWSTGAGWGLLLVYAAYARDKDDPVTTPLLTGIGNNSASILAALVVLPTTFALLPRTQALEVLGAGNQGLTFITMPGLFGRMPGGQVIGTFFFLALSFAAFSSLLSMMELGVRTLGDQGIGRDRATWITAAFGLAVGLPSALSMPVFNNQDWVWGIGLLVTGFLISLGVIKSGLGRFLDETVGPPGRRPLVRIWIGASIGGIIPLTFVVLLGWWFYKAITEYDPELWWNPLREFSVGTCVVQWTLGILIAVLASRLLPGQTPTHD